MAYLFTAEEQAQITAARQLAPLDNVATATGNWVAFYQTLSTIVTQHINDGSK